MRQIFLKRSATSFLFEMSLKSSPGYWGKQLTLVVVYVYSSRIFKGLFGASNTRPTLRRKRASRYATGQVVRRCRRDF